MKKKHKFVINLLLIICLSFVVLPNTICYATVGNGTTQELSPNTYTKPGTGAYTNDKIDDKFAVEWASKLSSLFFGLAVLIAIVAFMSVGVKYITGGVTEKADYKKDLIPMVVGIGIVVFLGTILSIIARAAGSI